MSFLWAASLESLDSSRPSAPTKSPQNGRPFSIRRLGNETKLSVPRGVAASPFGRSSSPPAYLARHTRWSSSASTETARSLDVPCAPRTLLSMVDSRDSPPLVFCLTLIGNALQAWQAPKRLLNLPDCLSRNEMKRLLSALPTQESLSYRAAMPRAAWKNC